MYNQRRAEQILSKIEQLPADEQSGTALKVLREFYLNDFFFFSKRFLQYKDLEWDVHGQFIKVFESKADRKIVVMPRGTFKSTLGSVAYPIWRLLRDPNLTILLDSELYSNSKNFLREIKGHLESSRMNKIFGPQVGPKWDEGEVIIKGRTRIRKEASITVGGIGTTKVGQHYDLIIGDDYNSPQNSETPEKCQKVIDHVRYNLNILNPGGEYLFIGTRYAERDVIGFFLGEILGEKNLAEGKLELMREKLLKVEEEILGG
jgi:hypothetical protein